MLGKQRHFVLGKQRDILCMDIYSHVRTGITMTLLVRCTAGQVHGLAGARLGRCTAWQVHGWAGARLGG